MHEDRCVTVFVWQYGRKIARRTEKQSATYAYHSIAMGLPIEASKKADHFTKGGTN